MIIVAGEVLVDLVIQPDGTIRATHGGGPFNAARTIGRLGGAVTFLGRLSTDRFGHDLRAALASDGVDLSMAEATDAPTTLAIADLDDDGAATYRFHTAETAAPELSRSAVEAALATRPAAFHLGTLGLVLEPMATALADGLASADPRTLVMVDPNCRPLAIRDRAVYLERLSAVLARSDVVKVSTDDLAYLYPDRLPGIAIRALLDRGPTIILVTDGSRPVHVVSAAASLEIPVPSARVVDTIGAGDAFGGGFLARWIERGAGRDELVDAAILRDAATFAIEVASLTCQRPGADPPRRAELGRSSG